VTNISDRNVTLTDLAINIKSFTTVNLLDSKHYQLTLEQLQKSEQCGSIFNKKSAIKVRKYPPPILKTTILCNRESVIPTRERSTLVITQENFEELRVSDEEFAEENADLVDQNAPLTSTHTDKE
jgi:hypothetical protein